MRGTYTVFDDDPTTTSGTDWPTARRVEFDYDGDPARELERVLETAAGSCHPNDYDVGHVLYAIAWRDGRQVATAQRVLTEEDLR